jgi:O-antigen chain-terminating methyltransferase
LLKQTRDDARARRLAAGGTRVPTLEQPRLTLRTAGSGGGRDPSVSADDLAALADPMAVDLRSHRPIAGFAVRGSKRALLRFLREVFGKQARYNRKAITAAEALAREGTHAAGILASRLETLEASAFRFAGRLSPTEIPFDYGAFEETFRGDFTRLRSALEGYLSSLEEAGASPVLDLGCGRGVFLEMLREKGIAAHGIDLDAQAVAAARSRGLDVKQGDLLEGLRAWPEGSLGAIVSFQVIEHLSLTELEELLRVAHERLRPGGTLVLETVNVSSPFALAHGWSIDPTHRLRLHPRVLRALVEQAGFQNVELRFAGPVEPPIALERVEDPRGRNFDRLAWIFAPQDCSLVARRSRLG